MKKWRFAAAAAAISAVAAIILLSAQPDAPVDPTGGEWDPTGPPGPRTLKFNKDYSMGSIAIRDWGSTDTEAWEPLGEAIGVVQVPAGKEVDLRLEPKPHTTYLQKVVRRFGIGPKETPIDFSCLDALGPNDVQSLSLWNGTDDKVLSHISGMRGLRRISFPSTWRLKYGPFPNITPNGFRHIAAFTNLRETRVSACGYLTDACLVHFRKFKLIEELDLRKTDVNGPGLIHLAGWPSLKRLYLPATIRSGGLKPLLQFRHLEELCLGEGSLRSTCGASGIDMAYLRNLRSLRDLTVYSSGLTDEGLAYLRDLRSLKSLKLGGRNIKGPGLRYLGEMTWLEELEISSQGLFVGGNLSGLKNLKNLRRLEIYSYVPDESDPSHREDAESLHKALPNCDFEWTYCV